MKNISLMCSCTVSRPRFVPKHNMFHTRKDTTCQEYIQHNAHFILQKGLLNMTYSQGKNVNFSLRATLDSCLKEKWAERAFIVQISLQDLDVEHCTTMVCCGSWTLFLLMMQCANKIQYAFRCPCRLGFGTFCSRRRTKNISKSNVPN